MKRLLSRLPPQHSPENGNFGNDLSKGFVVKAMFLHGPQLHLYSLNAMSCSVEVYI